MGRSKAVAVLLLLVFILIGALIGMLFSTPSLRLGFEDVSPLNEDWVYLKSGQEKVELDPLATRIDIDEAKAYTIERVLDARFETSQYLLVRTSLSNLTVHLDDTLLYEVDFDGERSYASSWHVIELPKSSDGQTLRLTFETPYESMRGILNEIHYGSVNALYAFIISQYGFRFMMGLTALLVGSGMFIASLALKQKENRFNVYLGLFGILISVWLLAESRMLQFFIGNANLLKGLSYMSLALLPVPLAIYLKYVFIKDHQRLYDLIIGFFLVQFIVVSLLHFTGLRSFFETVVVTITFISLVVFLTLYSLIKEYLSYRDNTNIKAIIFFGFMSIFIGVEVFVFTAGDFGRTADFAALAFSILLLLVFAYFLRFVFVIYKAKVERDLYEQLATKDQLTGAYNRYAYFNDIKNTPSEEKTALSIVYFDMDDLKAINDHYGHDAGDQAIMTAYNLIVESFGTQGKIYRMGGDEFIALIQDLTDEAYQTLSKTFEESLKAASKKVPYKIHISYGFAKYDLVKDDSLADTLRRSDQAMYKHKKTYKKTE